MSTEYRAAYYSHDGGEIVLTLPEHAHLSDAKLEAEALQEAIRAGLIDMDETDPKAAFPRLTLKQFNDGLEVGIWRE